MFHKQAYGVAKDNLFSRFLHSLADFARLDLKKVIQSRQHSHPGNSMLQERLKATCSTIVTGKAKQYELCYNQVVWCL
jgi:hypothetical protein